MRYSKIIDAVTQAFVYGDWYTICYVIPSMPKDELERCLAIKDRMINGGLDAFLEEIDTLYRERDMNMDIQKGA